MKRKIIVGCIACLTFFANAAFGTNKAPMNCILSASEDGKVCLHYGMNAISAKK